MAPFVHEAHEAGQVVPPITLIQTSGAADRNDRIAAFNREEGYPVIIRGVAGNDIVDRTMHVRSIDA
ncbi:hypothetical protein [Mesorhizobium qingshengii]|uniref:Tagaturonate reductase n=1 Tax=Mesorhizobium qingshengii TaxID=1165689 RepID=A0A1G5ZTZ4_9HYPH|nr:hypothetical protein [Mesorhizobium qingshengii]SDA98145.1 tagaturonate reductase [Mesorhizobium qingshengii]